MFIDNQKIILLLFLRFYEKKKTICHLTMIFLIMDETRFYLGGSTAGSSCEVYTSFILFCYENDLGFIDSNNFSFF